MYANKPCHLWSYQTEVHQIFIRCSPTISTVNAYSYTMMLQFVFLALVQLMQVVSVVINIFATLFDCHGKVPDKLENNVQIHHLHVKHFHMVNDCENRSSISRDIRINVPVFLAVSYLTFTNELCQLWSYWNQFHEIFTQYREASFTLLMRTLR